MSNAYTHEPPPQPGKLDVLTLVLADLQARSDAGLVKYGTRLQAGNWRDVRAQGGAW